MSPCEVHISKPRMITNSNVPMLEQIVSKQKSNEDWQHAVSFPWDHSKHMKPLSNINATKTVQITILIQITNFYKLWNYLIKQKFPTKFKNFLTLWELFKTKPKNKSIPLFGLFEWSQITDTFQEVTEEQKQIYLNSNFKH